VSSLDGVRAKLDRAREHVDTFDNETMAFSREHPYSIFSKHYPKTQHMTFRYVGDGTRPPITRWGVLIGDVLHEVSSALDHIAWQLALKTRPNPARTTAWPVCVRDGDWEGQGTKQMLRHIGADDRAFIKTKQPYPAPQGMDPLTHWAAMLRTLSRIDKHRVIHAAAVMPLDADINLDFVNVTPLSDLVLYNEPVKQGAKFARLCIQPTGPNPDVKMEVNASTYIAFIGPDYGHMHHGHVFAVLRILIRELAWLVDEAETRL
jgi:hypothetical protein